jgi:hypothetical protein
MKEAPAFFQSMFSMGRILLQGAPFVHFRQNALHVVCLHQRNSFSRAGLNADLEWQTHEGLAPSIAFE